MCVQYLVVLHEAEPDSGGTLSPAEASLDADASVATAIDGDGSVSRTRTASASIASPPTSRREPPTSVVRPLRYAQR